MSDVVTDVREAVEALAKHADALIEACTDPHATDLAELFWQLQQTRKQLQGVERDVETACAKAMLGDSAETPTLRVERSRGTDRKSWDHDAWRRDVRTKLLRKVGLAGAQGVVTAEGELQPVGVLHELLTAAQDVHSSAGPKTTALRQLGLDARDYCESSPGAWHVKVLPMADESEGAPSDE